MSPLTVTAGAARVECLNGRDTQRVHEAIPALHAGPTHRQGLAGVSRPERLRNPDPSRAKPIRWAWEARIPVGRPSLLVGNEGCGKGTLIAHLAARWSRGTLPGDLHGAPANVLIVGDEDTLDDVWTPRLYAAGADWARVWFPPEDAADIDFTAAADVERLRRWVRDHDAPIVVLLKAKSVRNAPARSGAPLAAPHPRLAADRRRMGHRRRRRPFG